MRSNFGPRLFDRQWALEQDTEAAVGILSAMIAKIDYVSDVVGRAVSWLTLLMVLITAYDVIMRYIFKVSFVFIQELEWYLFSLVFLLAAGYGLRHDSHVRVDIFYARLGPRGQAWVNVGGTLLFLFPTCFLLIKGSLPFVQNSWSDLEGSPDPGGIPFRYLLKTAIPVAFLLLAFQGIAHLLKNLGVAIGWAEPAKEGVRSV